MDKNSSLKQHVPLNAVVVKGLEFGVLSFSPVQTYHLSRSVTQFKIALFGSVSERALDRVKQLWKTGRSLFAALVQIFLKMEIIFGGLVS